jgi:peptidoglycan/xylan/chitin deacetylase (PgdA/CDA1 family)
MRPGRRASAAIAAGLASVAGLLVLPPAPADLARPPAPRPLAAPAVRVLPPPPLTVREARLARREHAAIDRVLRYTGSVSAGGRQQREVALTFDDGPSPYTPAVIAVLRRLHVPATFFQTGTSIANFPRAARAELALGLSIGDHTETHPFLASLAPRAQRAEIIADAHRIHAYGAPYPRLFRPPYESFDPATVGLVRAAHMLMVLWSVDTRDFSRPGVGQIVATAVSGAGPGAIILMHDGGGPRDQTVAALPRVIAILRARRYRLVTVGRLLLDDPPPPPRRAAVRPRVGGERARHRGPPAAARARRRS